MGKSIQLNDAEFHYFNKGWQKDMDQHAEKSDTYDEAWNGRLYSDNGTLSYQSLTGTRKIYENPEITDYLGFYAFKDELIVIGKSTKELESIEYNYINKKQILVSDFEISSGISPIVGINFSTKFTENIVTVKEPIIEIDLDDFNQNVTDVEDTRIIPSDYDGLFKEIFYNTTTTTCPTETGIPFNNTDNTDFVMSFTYNENNELIGKFIFVGYLNLPKGAKIICRGVEENNYYKRVYFTDYYNPSRVINLKDTDISTRDASEFDLKAKGTLLNPRIVSVNKNGSLKAMTVFYIMRLTTVNGQTTDYSPLSKAVRIVKDDSDITFKGGDISQITNKSVSVDCYIPDYKSFENVELISLEYQAKDVPTVVRLVGRKKASSIVNFEHFGTESALTDNITLTDIFTNSITWRYNSDWIAKNNKLIAVGLRNDPTYVNSKEVDLDFALKGFDKDGNTHNCLLNPNPELYNYISNDLAGSFVSIKRKLYKTIQIFGNFKVKLENYNSVGFYEKEQADIIYSYKSYIDYVKDFLLEVQEDVDFQTNFPNLLIKETTSGILFTRLDELIETDLRPYLLTFSTSQVIIEMDNDVENKAISWPVTDAEKEANLVYGGISSGWHSGNGVKITMHSKKEIVLEKNTSWMVPGQFPLNIKKPSLNKFVMKGEIYRLGIAWYKNGNRLFTTILGDIKIPEIGQKKRELNENGQVINTNDTYKNWSIEGDDMYAEGIELQIDVRINCRLSKEVDSYQIVYVERTEANRTILAQGISAPLERVNTFTNQDNFDISVNEKVNNKWNLPSHGGPVYDAWGIAFFDVNENEVNPDKRVITNRRMFYFDSPDFIYDKIGVEGLDSTSLDYIETIATDHDRRNIVGGFSVNTNGAIGTNSGSFDFGVPKFSQKIPIEALTGVWEQRPFFVNTSIFASLLKRRTFTGFNNTLAPFYELDSIEYMKEGEVKSGYKFNSVFDVSNNALTLAAHGWYFALSGRSVGQNNGHTTPFRVNNISAGRNSIFIKSKEHLFTAANIVQSDFAVQTIVNFGATKWSRQTVTVCDAYIVSNLRKKNSNSIYGGRSEYAYSTNEYIPLSDVIPVDTEKEISQLLYVQGDTYCSLYLRNKSSYKESSPPQETQFQWSNKANHNDSKYQYNKYNAWCYGVVLESTVEPRLNNSEEFYRFSKDIGFNYDEMYNNAYIQENTLRKSLPVPYNFKDDPNLDNIIAVSVPKMTGDYIDAWTKFLTNEFYELEKNMGAALNIGLEKDELYVVQELQTSKILIDERSFVTPDSGGKAIQINQGSGTSVSGHQPVSEYGTSRRRAIVPSPFGFLFFDERKTEILKIVSPLLLSNNLLMYAKEFFDINKVIDVEGYYDEKYKETNLRFKTSTGTNFVISYNEVFKAFNGKIDYDNSLYMTYDNKVIVPNDNSRKLDELNSGNELTFFGVKKNLKMKVISAPNAMDTKINKGIALYADIDYPILKSIFETSLGDYRSVLGTHHWYKIREGVHTLPSKNQTDYEDIRGEWCSIDIEIQSQKNKKINLFSLVNFFRKSYK